MSQLQFQWGSVINEREIIRNADKSTVTLRPYQAEACEWVMRQFDAGVRRVLVSAATGTGKSVIFTTVMERMKEWIPDQKILLLAHRGDLLKQAVGHAARASLTGSLEKAANVASSRCDVVCASVATMVAKSKCEHCGGRGCDNCDDVGKILRMETFDPNYFSLIITDEAHHAAATTYRAVYEYFEERNPDIYHLGVTATPRRGDCIGLSAIYDDALDVMPLGKAMSEAWLCPIREQFVQCDSLSLRGLKTRMGDFTDKSINQAFVGGDSEDVHRKLHEVALPIAEICGDGTPFMLFVATKAHAEQMAEALLSYPQFSNRIELILGNTPDDERDRIKRRMEAGESVGIVNCGVCTEGYDLPIIQYVFIARPTKSETLLLQMVGRGTRTVDGCIVGMESASITERAAAIAASRKTHCTVVHFCGRKELPVGGTIGGLLSGLPVGDKSVLAAMRAALKSNEPVDLEELINTTKKKMLAKQQAKQERRELQASGVTAEGEYTVDTIDFGEKFNAFTDYTPGPGMATQKQVNLLVKLGVKPQTAIGYTKRQAGSVIDSYSKKAPMKGMMPNAYPGKCFVTGKKVSKRDGWAMRVNGKWCTFSSEGASQYRDQLLADTAPAYSSGSDDVQF